MNMLGERLIERQMISEHQLQEALERQRLEGGRLGSNLVALGFVQEEDLETLFRRDPPPAMSVAESGLDLTFIADLVLKHVAPLNDFGFPELTEKVRLPFQVLDQAIELLRKQHFLEVKGAAQFVKASWRFCATDTGRNHAGELMEICRYLGPAPVPLESYRRMIEMQTIKSIIVHEKEVRETFSRYVVSEDMLTKIGPAVSSGRSIFLYGPPGNGKTTIAEAIGRLLPGAVYIPYALLVDNEIITIFDPVSHIAMENPLPAEQVDQRWVLIRRPVIMVGGEFSLRMLDLDFNPIAKFYQAALQMKANNGIFIVDDFGRQQIDPEHLLNRWIVPLERRTDFLSLHTGMKFEIPFDQLVIFSTNLEPKKLVDEAFLRRIRYKIKIDHPSEEAYQAIFRRVCASNGIEFRPKIFDYLLHEYYRRLKVPFNACHPRDIVDHIIDSSHYYSRSPELTREAIDAAWGAYFVDM